nr:hypothetical protein [Escherichia coli]
MKTKKLMMVALVSSTLALSGCGAMSTAIKKRNLEVKTQMSETIWLKPNDGCTGQFHSGPFRVWCDEHSNQEA